METLIAYHGKPAIKKKYLARVAAHRKADELHQGMTGEGGKGCAVWCTLNAYNHSQYPIQLGIPEVVAHLEDKIFEGLSVAESKLWPERFLSAIAPGADLSKIWPQFAEWLMDETIQSISDTELKDVLAALTTTRDLYHRVNNDVKVEIEEWQNAASAAYAAHAAAYSDAYSAASAAYAANAAAHAAAYSDASAASAAYAANAAAHAAAYSDASAVSAAYAANAAAHAAANAAAYAASAASAADASNAAFWSKASNKMEQLLKEAK